MKRGTETKFKFKALKARLGLPLWQVKGILQSLWDFAGENAIEGNIGRFSNGQLALGIEWPEDKADELVKALVDTVWLDEHPEHRLVIHDWMDHCEEWIKKSIVRRRQKRIDDTPSAVAADTGGRAAATSKRAAACHSHNHGHSHGNAASAAFARSDALRVDTEPNVEVWGRSRIKLDAKKGAWLGIEPEDWSRWKVAYPAVDLVREANAAASWCVANPVKGRKQNYGAFLVKWFGRCQERSGPSLYERRDDRERISRVEAPPGKYDNFKPRVVVHNRADPPSP